MTLRVRLNVCCPRPQRQIPPGLTPKWQFVLNMLWLRRQLSHCLENQLRQVLVCQAWRSWGQPRSYANGRPWPVSVGGHVSGRPRWRRNLYLVRHDNVHPKRRDCHLAKRPFAKRLHCRMLNRNVRRSHQSMVDWHLQFSWSCNAEGTHASVNNSNQNIFGATIAAGGSNHVLAYCDGTNWTVAGI